MGHRNTQSRTVACDLASRASLEALVTAAVSTNGCAKKRIPGPDADKRRAKFLYITSQPPTKHGIPPADAMQFVSRETKESRSGVIVIVIFRATFEGAVPCEGASNPAGGCSSPVVVQLHRTLSAVGELAARMRAPQQSVLRAMGVEVEGLGGDPEWRAMSSSSVVEKTRYWPGEFGWQAGR